MTATISTPWGGLRGGFVEPMGWFTKTISTPPLGSNGKGLGSKGWFWRYVYAHTRARAYVRREMISKPPRLGSNRFKSKPPRPTPLGSTEGWKPSEKTTPQTTPSSEVV